MTDQDRTPEGRLPARRPASTPASAERFSAPPSTHATGGLTPSRTAQIVRQTGSARWVAFLGVSIVALFVIAYYFYETGLPLGLSQARLEAQATAQQVTAVERGYNLYQANCARCHGVNGEGGIGPVLNDQMKLFDHLNPDYIKTVLTVGGRYVCGDPKSLMPVWADTNNGPLNYVAIQDLIAFLRAPKTEEFVVHNTTLNEPVIGPDGKVVTFRGWVDPSFKPAPSATPFPACYKGDQGGGGTPAPSTSLPPDAVTLELVALNFAFDKKELEVPANQPFAITLDNQDAVGAQHNVQIKDASGNSLSDPAPIDGGQKTTYVYDPLPPGTYTFICRIHPIPAMTGTLTVK